MSETKYLDKYHILEELGRGGFSSVYRASDTKLGRDVAIKRLHHVSLEESSFIERFRREARTAASLSHPNIVHIDDFGESEGIFYIAMELVDEGYNLQDLLKENAPLLPNKAIDILVQLAQALDYLHQHDPPLVHRDLKPSNVLLERRPDDLRVILTDFGLVRSMEASSIITKSGTILGTPAYMAPEQAESQHKYDITTLTDIYAFGVIAYQLFTGHLPFTSDSPMALLHAHAYDRPPSPLHFLPDLGEDLAEVLLRALEKQPSNRFQCAGEIVAELQQVVTTQVTVTEQQGKLHQLKAQADEYLYNGNWLEANRILGQILTDNPGWLEEESLKSRIRAVKERELEKAKISQLSEEYKVGSEALAEGKWDSAISSFQKIAELDTQFRDVQKKLDQAYMHKRGVALQHVITITGSSGSGKSTAARYFQELADEDKRFKPELVPKYTTRPERDDDRDEVICKEELPVECDLVYEHCAERYGIELSRLFDLVTKGKSPIIILNDIRAVEDVRDALGKLVRSVFIFREEKSLEQYHELAEERGIIDIDPEEPERRFSKAQSLYRSYIENIHLFDHVIINSDSFEKLRLQVEKIVIGLRQDPNWPLREGKR